MRASPPRPDLPPRPGASADLLTALVLLVLGLAMLYGAWSMDRLEVRRIHPASVPGLVPGFLGTALAITAALLLVRSWRAGGRDLATLAPGPGVAGQLGLTLLLTLAYPLLLLGNMPFPLATFLFVMAFITVFEWQDEGPRWRRLLTAFVQAVLVALAVTFVFQNLFLVRLP